MTSDVAEIRVPDWERIELDYRAGVRSVRSIAAAHGLAHSSIQWRAKVQGWVREVTAKGLCAGAVVVSQVGEPEAGRVGESAVAMVGEALRVDALPMDALLVNEWVPESQGDAAGVYTVAEVQLCQRRDIARLRALVMKITRLLEHPSEALTLQQQIDCAKKLSETQKTLIALEREAYGIDKGGDKDADQAQQVPASLEHMYGQVHAESVV